MVHTTVELDGCHVDILPESIRFKELDGQLLLSISYSDFDEILEAVSKYEKFIERQVEGEDYG